MSKKIIYIILLVSFVLIIVIANMLLQSKNNYNNEREENNMEISNVTGANFEKEVLNSEQTVLIDFYADWCGPCKMLSPIVEQVASENPDVKVVKVNVDNEQDLAIKYQVMSIPTLVVIKNGAEANRMVGLSSKSDIVDMIK